MSDLIVPSLPENFHTRRNVAALPGDIYNICQRVKDKYPTLHITLKDDGSAQPYVISEYCKDGKIRFVSRYEKLTPQIIDDLDYMQRVPYAQRVEESERRAKARNEELSKPDPEKQERWMAEFRKDLIRAGFVHGAIEGGSHRRLGKLPRRTKRKNDG